MAVPVAVVTRQDASRFWSKVQLGKDEACWPWVGSKNRYGYGLFRFRGRPTLVHRFVYECLVGPIPEGWHVDHLCFVRNCVNPRHLEAVTPAVNNRRAVARGALARAVRDSANLWRRRSPGSTDVNFPASGRVKTGRLGSLTDEYQPCNFQSADVTDPTQNPGGSE